MVIRKLITRTGALIGRVENRYIMGMVGLVLGVAGLGLMLLSGAPFSAEATTTAALISIDDVTLAEGDSGNTAFIFTISLSEAAGDVVSVEASSVDGSATGGDDFTSFSGKVISFPAGTTAQSLTVNVRGEALVEATESFQVTLANPLIGGVADAGAVTIGDNSGLATINNDDTASISIADLTVTETDGGYFLVNAEITLDKPVDVAVQIGVQSADGSALSPDDYRLIFDPLYITFSAGVAHVKEMSVGINGDTLVEENETFHLSLFDLSSNGRAVSIGDGDAVVTIEENDSATLTINDATLLEGDSGSSLAVFTVTLNHNTSTPFTLPYATTDDSATTADADYVANSGTLSFVGIAGETQQISVQVNGDTLVEATEQFSITLGNPVAGRLDVTVAEGGGVGTISADDSGSITLSGPGTFAEGDSGTHTLDFTVTLSEQIDHLTLDYATEDGSAEGGSDYVSASGMLTFSKGSALTQTISVDVPGDSSVELDELFTTIISNVTFANPDTAAWVTVNVDSIETTILNDDVTALSLSDASIVEGDSGTQTMYFTLSLSAPAAEPISVEVNSNDISATAGSDYTAISSLIMTFEPGAPLTQTLSTTIAGDLDVETSESFKLTLSNLLYDGEALAAVTLADATGIGSIVNDDFVDVSIADAGVDEAAGVIEFVLSLSAVSAENVTLTLNTISDSATGGSDFTALNNTLLTIPVGETSAILTVPIKDDALYEATESFSVTLSSPQNVIIVDGTAVGTITDNDSKPTVNLFDLYANETGLTATVTAILDQVSGMDVRLDYLTNNVTANSPDDFSGTPGQVTIPAGSTGTMIAIALADDEVYEGLETFTVELSQATNAVIGDGNATIVIADNEAPPTLFVNESVGSEATGSLSFTVSLASPTELAATVKYALVADSAESPADYSSHSGTLTFPTGTTSLEVQVDITDDNFAEGNETFKIVLSDPVNTTLGSRAIISLLNASATGTIIDNDMVGITFHNPHSDQPLEEGDSQTVTITLDSEPLAPVTVSLIATPAAQCTVSSPVILDANNWQSGVPVTISVLQDFSDDGAQECVVSIDSISSVDRDYDNPAITPPTVVTTIAHRDPVTLASGLSYLTPAGQELVVNAPGVLAGSPTTTPMTVTLSGGPTSGTLNMNTDGSFEYLPSAEFVGTLTFTYTVTDGYSTVIETATIEVAPLPNPNESDSSLVDDISDTELFYLDGQENKTSVTIPANAVTETITAMLVELPDGPNEPLPQSLVSANETFDFSAYPNGEEVAPFAFQQPVTITIEYDEADVEGLIEEGLAIHYWDEKSGTWLDAITTCSPSPAYARDLKNNTLSIRVCQTGEFTLVGVRVPTAIRIASSTASATFSQWSLPLAIASLALASALIVKWRSINFKRQRHS